MNKTAKWYARPLYAIMALALVAGLTLVPTLVPVASPIVEAAVSNITVWVGDPTPSGSSNYTINFTTTVKLTTAAGDTIIVDFPAGTTDNTTISNITAATTWVNGTVASSVTIGGRRVSVTPGADVDAGNVIVVFSGNKITNPRPEGSYTLTVYTTQEPTTVTSTAYAIDTIVTTLTVNNTPERVNHLANYTIATTLATALTADVDTITITFPATTTVPTSIAQRTNITIDGNSLDSTANYSASGQTITLSTPEAVSKDAVICINFTTGVGLKNPTSIRSNWTLNIYTSKDRGVKISDTYSTTAGNESVITQTVWDTYDAYVPNNTCSSVFYIRTLDANGVNATVNAETTFVLGATNGVFYSNSGCSSPIGTKVIDEDHSKSGAIYYKCSSPGTQYLTARDLAENWTKANQTVIVNPMVQLWGGGVCVAEHATISAAADAALSYDTIKVLPSTYQEDFTINRAHVTIESISGPASTTVIIASSNRIIDVTAVNATIDGLHLQGDGGEGDRGIYLRYSGFTVKNCTINNTDNDGIIVESSGGAITSGIIDNCTITGTGANSTVYRSGILMEAYDDHDISGVTISNNTVSAYGSPVAGVKDAKGIKLAGGVAGDGKGNVTAKIVNNTITNCRTGLNLRGDLSNATSLMTGANATANNTLSDCYVGVLLHWTLNADYSLIDNTISNNTAYGIYLAADGTLNSTGKLIKHNNIYGNAYAGINNTYTSMTSDLVATYNWWGNASGPGGVGPGTGDNVTAYVTYSPWLNEPYPSGNTTAFSNITLKTNWNFISVPRKMANATFGYLLSGINFSTAWGYNASTATWVNLTSSSAVEVLSGYWIDSNEAATINLTFVSTGQEVPASKNLTGNKWNAIGFSNLTAVRANATLKSVEGSWSTAMGWNATDQCYDASIIYEMNDNTTMNPGKGYWLWMTANDTLAALSA